jgi:hypothetical protein
MVSSIYYSVRGARGGKYKEDQFDIVAADLVADLVGPFNKIVHGALVFRDMSKTVVMLVPPLTFTFKTRRVDGGSFGPTELVVTGHFMCLVHREGKDPRCAFVDERAEYARESKQKGVNSKYARCPYRARPSRGPCPARTTRSPPAREMLTPEQLSACASVPCTARPSPTRVVSV